MTTLDDTIKAIVDRAPPLTEDQVDRLAGIFYPEIATRRPKDQRWHLEESRRRDAQESDLAGVYFILRGARIKIGMSNNVIMRMGGIRRESSEPIKLIAYVPMKGEARRRTLEKRFHDQWAEIRRFGEWFEATPDLVRWIASLIQDGTAVPDVRRA